jgi:hypothetical protein
VNWLQLASQLWRLRRATAIETGLFNIEADRATDCGHGRLPDSAALHIVPTLPAPHRERIGAGVPSGLRITNGASTLPGSAPTSAEPAAGHVDLAHHFLRLADL